LNGVIVKVNGSLIGGACSNISIGGTGPATDQVKRMIMLK
jgi:hypothetical protein